MDISNPRKLDALSLWYKKTPIREISHSIGVSVSIIKKWIKESNDERYWECNGKLTPEPQQWEPKTEENR